MSEIEKSVESSKISQGKFNNPFHSLPFPTRDGNGYGTGQVYIYQIPNPLKYKRPNIRTDPLLFKPNTRTDPYPNLTGIRPIFFMFLNLNLILHIYDM